MNEYVNSTKRNSIQNLLQISSVVGFDLLNLGSREVHLQYNKKLIYSYIEICVMFLVVA